MNINYCIDIPSFAKTPYNQASESMNSRLRCAISSTGNAEELSDRVSLIINRDWVAESIPRFDEDQLLIAIWPGNTKGQGWHLYPMDMKWLKKESIIINGIQYRIKIVRHIKFAHFGKYITSLDIPIKDGDAKLKKEINTPENHYNLSGRWYRKQWGELNTHLSAHFNFDWKKKCDWINTFEKTGRNIVDMSLGYSITLYVPYERLQEIDIKQNDYKEVGKFLQQCTDELIAVVEKQ